MFRRFREGSIRWQIVTLAALPVLVVGVLGILTEPLFPEDTQLARAEVLAAQIDLLAGQLEHAPSAADADAVLEATRASGLDVRLADPFFPEDQVHFGYEERLLFALNEIHARRAWAILPSDGVQRIVVDVAGSTLSFSPPIEDPPRFLNDDVVNILLSILLITLPVIVLSLYAATLIVAPLTGLSTAALAQGSVGPDTAVFEESGPHELRLLARRLNDMRRQVHVMLGERTSMLRAVSHDLRTPLTRLKLRVERSIAPATAGILLRDINAINDMIDETLNYLRADSQIEPLRKSDLPSLLGSICSDFTDIGFAVTYSGPDRLSFTCRPKALARAISNLIDNATKHGDQVGVTLAALPGGGIRIEVLDNGPGIPAPLREKVTEPFVKADPARPADKGGGFGLGLSIVHEIVRRHGGQLSLLPRDPTGLMVAIMLPPTGT
jgi:signal transduction histidine kinase